MQGQFAVRALFHEPCVSVLKNAQNKFAVQNAAAKAAADNGEQADSVLGGK